MKADCSTAVIGAGVIGLSIAAALSEDDGDIYVLERNGAHGMGISSRNSEVIHAGIYYPPGSLKARLCVEGRELLYETCAKYGIPHRRTGKLIIATDEAERETLEGIMNNAARNGVALRFLESAALREMEPNVRAVAALHSPDTGIVSAHHLMDHYLRRAKQAGVELACATSVFGIRRVPGGYRIATAGPDGGRFEFVAERVVNAAGLHSDEIAAMAGMRYRLHYCKGDYFSINNQKRGVVRRLIYPVPEANLAGLGVHLTLDLNGRMRLGPDTAYTRRAETYEVNGAKKKAFYERAVRFLPFIRQDDIEPDMSGIRPKLQGPGDGFRDFVISEDLPGFVNLVGIESPGLTAAPAIARHVRAMLAGRTVHA